MDPYQETHETWNKIAQVYLEKFMDLTIYNHTYDAFCNALNDENASVLEIGCGPGNISKFILKKLPNLKYLGTDISPNMIKLASENNPTAQFRNLDARNIIQLNKKYNAIVCGFCLPYLNDLDSIKFIKDCSSLLNKNGLMYLSFVEGEKSQSGLIKGSTGDRSFFNYYTLNEINQMFEKYSFKILNLYNVEYSKSDHKQENHTVIIASRL